MGNDEYNVDRIDRLEQELARLENIVDAQQKEIALLKQMNTAPQPQAPPMVQWQMQHVSQPQAQQMPQQQQMPPHQPQINPEAYGLPPVGRKTTIADRMRQNSIENRLGNSMGIIASVLIFISMVLFVTLVYSSLTDIIKVTCIFALSFAILAAGIVLMKRRTNIFTMSVAGCGMGAIFLSLFVAHIYFGMIDRIVLYILITIWAVAVFGFFQKKSYAFRVVGQAGVTIAAVFGAYALDGTRIIDGAWMGQYVSVFVFFVAVSLFYLIVRPERGAAKNAPLAIMDYIGIFAVSAVGAEHCTQTGLYVIMAVTWMYMFGILFRYIWASRQGTALSDEAGIIYVGLSLSACYVTASLGDGINSGMNAAAGFITFAVNVIITGTAYAAELYRTKLYNACPGNAGTSDAAAGVSAKNYNIVHIIMSVILYLMLLNKTTEFDALYDMVGIGIYIFPMLAAAYYCKDRTALWLAYATMAVFAVSGCEYITIRIIICILGAAMACALMAYRKEMYHPLFKCALYAVIIVTIRAITDDVLIIQSIPRIMRNTWIYIVLAVINCAAVHLLDRSRSEKPALLFTGGFNALLMLQGMSYLEGSYSWWIKLIILVVAAGTFTTGINVLYEKCGTKTWAGIYTGLKLSVFVYAALHAYEVTGPYVSIGWLVLSIILIASGFVFRYRYLRMYGMFLTMFAIVKLLVFDISYENGIVRAGSFLVSGLLCFVISMIYNKWSRKMEGEKNGDE